MKVEEDIVLIAGPTASGKTKIAIEIAKANDALILNADSMQVYKALQVITARPSAQEEAQAPHHLFGHVDGNSDYSVSHWLEDVRPFLTMDRKLVFVGGTGMYFNALLDGLSPMPEIKPEMRDKWRAMEEVPTPELHAQLDEAAAAQLRPSDRQRILRALEVYESTGKSIIEWQELEGVSILPEGMSIKKILMMPERSILHERINMRFDTMVEEGALDEVKSLLARSFDKDRSVLKAIGVPHLGSYLRGYEDLDEAIEKAKAATRQYAKRQSTWFRNSFDEDWEVIN